MSKIQRSKGEEESQEIPFEKAIEKLEKIVEFLESGEAPLEESLKKYEEGVRLARLCGERLSQAEKKIEVLTRQLDGTLKAVPFEAAIAEAEEEAKKESKEKRSGTPEKEEGLLF